MYLKGLHLGIGPSSPVVIEVHLLSLESEKHLYKYQRRRQIKDEREPWINNVLPSNIPSQYIQKNCFSNIICIMSSSNLVYFQQCSTSIKGLPKQVRQQISNFIVVTCLFFSFLVLGGRGLPDDEKHHKMCNYSLNQSSSQSHPLSIRTTPCRKQSSRATHTGKHIETESHWNRITTNHLCFFKIFKEFLGINELLQSLKLTWISFLLTVSSESSL